MHGVIRNPNTRPHSASPGSSHNHQVAANRRRPQTAGRLQTAGRPASLPNKFRESIYGGPCTNDGGPNSEAVSQQAKNSAGSALDLGDYDALKMRVDLLWEKMRMPMTDLDEFEKEHRLENITTRLALLNLVLLRLQHFHYLTHAVLRCIRGRENALSKLEDLLDGFNSRTDDSNLAQRKKKVGEFLEMYSSSTVKVVEVIGVWREALVQPYPFMWCGENYMLKVLSDSERLLRNIALQHQGYPLITPCLLLCPHLVHQEKQEGENAINVEIDIASEQTSLPQHEPASQNENGNAENLAASRPNMPSASKSVTFWIRVPEDDIRRIIQAERDIVMERKVVRKREEKWPLCLRGCEEDVTVLQHHAGQESKNMDRPVSYTHSESLDDSLPTMESTLSDYMESFANDISTLSRPTNDIHSMTLHTNSFNASRSYGRPIQGRLRPTTTPSVPSYSPKITHSFLVSASGQLFPDGFLTRPVLGKESHRGFSASANPKDRKLATRLRVSTAPPVAAPRPTTLLSLIRQLFHQFANVKASALGSETMIDMEGFYKAMVHIHVCPVRLLRSEAETMFRHTRRKSDRAFQPPPQHWDSKSCPILATRPIMLAKPLCFADFVFLLEGVATKLRTTSDALIAMGRDPLPHRSASPFVEDVSQTRVEAKPVEVPPSEKPAIKVYHSSGHASGGDSSVVSSERPGKASPQSHQRLPMQSQASRASPDEAKVDDDDGMHAVAAGAGEPDEVPEEVIEQDVTVVAEKWKSSGEGAGYVEKAPPEWDPSWINDGYVLDPKLRGKMQKDMVQRK